MSNKQKMVLSGAGFIVSFALLIAATMLAEEAVISASLAAVLITVSVILVITAICFLAKVDYETGVYTCRNCANTFKPTFPAYLFGMHTITTRYLKCPECGKSTWCKRRSIEKGE